MIRKHALPLLALALSPLTFAAPVAAQDAPREPTAFDGDYLSVGVGAAVGPSYEGSDDYVVFPVPVIQGRLKGIGINPRAGGLALDFINDPTDAKVSFQLGPVARLKFDRNTQISDPVVKALGERDVAVEVGPTAGVSFNRLLNPYDSLSFSADVRWDVAGAHEGMLIAPAVSYMTPLSKASLAVLSVSAEHVDDNYARYYFSVTPTESTTSGLPVYSARGGWKSVSAGLLGVLDLDGNLTNGGFAVFAGANYSRLLGNFERAPVVSVVGRPDQFTGVIGIGYTF